MCGFDAEKDISHRSKRLTVRCIDRTQEQAEKSGFYKHPVVILPNTDEKGGYDPGKGGISKYKVELVTSTSRGSDLSVARGRVWVALIGEQGRSTLRCVNNERLRLQKGDVDVFEFLAPDLGRLEALWVGPEAGTWRLEEARVTKKAQDEEESVYIFKGNGELLGDGGDVSAIELKPRTQDITEYIRAQEEMKEQGMKEYETLKKSSLLSDAFLVTLGTGILRLAGYKRIASGFLFGGAGGFLYLFLLQGIVDRVGKSADSSGLVSSLKNSTPRLLLVVSLLFTVAKTQVQQLGGEELLGGAAGFMVFKAAILLAAINPSDNQD